ncbi:MAG: hypothetical protein KJ706_05600 [Candidatus Omnitrophica bacterium]|nr:hypothetical protein [Candidatus Omnitrophota bacterium]
MGNDYKFLKIGTTIFKVLAWVSVAVGVISALVIFMGGGTAEAPRATGFVGLLLGVVYFFIFTVASEVIALLLDLNSRIGKGPSA